MPYRTHRDEPLPPADTSGDTDLLPGALLLWLASVACCAHRLVRREPFSGEADLAMICVILLPFAAFRSIKKV